MAGVGVCDAGVEDVVQRAEGDLLGRREGDANAQNRVFLL